MTQPHTRAAELHLDDMLPYLMNRLVARLNQNLAEDLRKRGFTDDVLRKLCYENWINVLERSWGG